MNFPLIYKTLGFLLVLLSLVLFVPFAVALYYSEEVANVFIISALTSFLLGLILFLVFGKASGQIPKRSAFLLVTLGWLTATLIGSFPFYYSGAYPTMVDAWFESVSGFTTTGASVLANLEALPKSILLWRSMTQFLGGMGIIVLSLAVLPLLGVGGMELYRAEAPGPTSDKISARVGETAKALWVVYVAFIAIEVLVLVALGMGKFDALNHAMTTMATGGFSTKNSSVASFDSAAIDYAISFFMFLAGINFVLHYRLLFRRDFKIFQDRELKFYLFLTISTVLLLTSYLRKTSYETWFDSLRYAVFQITAIISSTGFGTADFVLWGPFAQCLLVSLMIVGGCAGSTAGGIKCVRAMMLVKQGFRELYFMVHPKAVAPLKLGDTPVAARVASAIFGYFFLYIMLLAVATLILGALGVDLVTAASGTISALSNIGPGLGEVGPALNYAGLPDLAKIVLGFCMLIGRLEIFTVLVIFTKEYWDS